MKISIITVSYNSESTIRDTIESVLMQTYSDIEYIIIDGKSTDQTVNIIQEYQDRIAKFISEADKGIYEAMNKGINFATGDVIGILNSDDFYKDRHVITEVAATFKGTPKTQMVLGGVDFVSGKDLTKVIRSYKASGFKPWMLRFGFMPPHPGSFIRREVYKKIGFYKLGYKIAADFDFFVRSLLVSKLQFITLDNIWVRMRAGGISTSGLQSYKTSTKEIIRSLEENKIYSNLLFVLMRLPIKGLQLTFRKYRIGVKKG